MKIEEQQINIGQIRLNVAVLLDIEIMNQKICKEIGQRKRTYDFCSRSTSNIDSNSNWQMRLIQVRTHIFSFNHFCFV